MTPIVSVTTFKALFRLTRFWNLTIIALAQYFTAYFLLHAQILHDIRLFLLVGSTLLIAAAGYVINDYYDIKIDLINKPDRVVIGKGITRRYALFFHTLLSVTGVAIGFFLNWKIGVINFLSAALLWWYSNYLKRLPFVGNLSVALLTGVAILLINMLYQSLNSFVFVYSIFAFAMTLVREIIKDMEDWKGDNTFGCKTLPIIWGMRKTKQLLYTLLLLFVLIVLVINAFYVGLPIYYFLSILFIPVGFLLIRLIRADTRKDFEYLSKVCKVILLLGILTMPLV